MKSMARIIAILLLTEMTMAKVDFNLSGEGVAYYQTNNDGKNDFFSQDSSRGSLGLQLDVEAKVDNGFKLGYQGTFLGTLGLDKSIISNGRQYTGANDLNGYTTTKFHLWKRFSETSFKLGRQELSEDISPMAFSEGWNVFKNTFDALVIRNEDLADTSVVAVYINKANGHNDLSSLNDLSSTNGQAVDGGAYMLTILNKSFKDMPMMGSYYFLKDLNKQENVSVFWFDVKSKQTAFNLAFQTAHINPSNTLSNTTLVGAKVSKTHNDLGFSLAYSSVSSGGLSFQNMGTQGDVAFYTQMVNNQDHIALDAQTVVAKASAKLPVGNLTLQYGLTKDTSSFKNDFTELDVVYKFDLMATKMFVGYIRQTTEQKIFAGEDDNNNIRIWSRYRF